MSDSQSESSLPSSPEDVSLSHPALGIAERWADYTRAFAIYPDSNQRVVETRKNLINSLAPLKDGTDQTLGIRFSGSEVTIGSQRHVIQPRTNLQWLGQRLEPALLSGVGFQVDHVNEFSLDAFTRNLLRLYSQSHQDSPFEEKWPNPYDGIALLERRFEGSFSDGEVTQSAAGGGSVNVAGSQSLARKLLRSEEIRAKLDELKDQLEFVTPSSDSKTRSIDLVMKILDRVPVDVMQSVERVHDLVVDVLGTINNHDTHTTPSQREFDSLLAKASQQFFSRSGPGSIPAVEEVVEPGPSGHKGDDGITDDLQSFFQEYSKLEKQDPSLKEDVGLEDRLEQLGVYLYYAAHIESDNDRARLVGPKLRQWLSNAGPEECHVLRVYLDHLGDPDHSEKSERVLEILVRQGLGRLIRDIYPRSVEQILRTFPDGFGLYLASIDFHDSQHRLELERTCSRIPIARMSAASDRFLRRSWELEPERIKSLFASASSSLMGLAHVAIKNGGEPLRSVIVTYLRTLNLESPEACLLWVLEDLNSLSASYLESITFPNQDGRYPIIVREHVVESICRFIQSIAHKPDQTPRRVYAIKHLSQFPTESARRFLEDLLASRYLLIPKESSTVRQAAKSVLRRLRS